MFEFRLFLLLDWLRYQGSIARGRIVGFIPFPKMLSANIFIQDLNLGQPISNDDGIHYITNAFYIYIYIYTHTLTHKSYSINKEKYDQGLAKVSKKVSKFGDRSQGLPESSVCNNYNTEV